MDSKGIDSGSMLTLQMTCSRMLQMMNNPWVWNQVPLFKAGGGINKDALKIVNSNGKRGGSLNVFSKPHQCQYLMKITPHSSKGLPCRVMRELASLKVHLHQPYLTKYHCYFTQRLKCDGICELRHWHVNGFRVYCFFDPICEVREQNINRTSPI